MKFNIMLYLLLNIIIFRIMEQIGQGFIKFETLFISYILWFTYEIL